MALVEQTLDEIARTSGRWYEAELHRVKGDLLVAAGDTAAAERTYETAVSVSDRQGARLWQLRATNGLASLWRLNGAPEKIPARLGPLYAAFDKQVVIADLREASALLSEAGWRDQDNRARA